MKGLANPPYTRTKIECFQRVETSHAEIFKKDVIEFVTDEMPAGEAIMDPTHHLIGHKGATDQSLGFLEQHM